MRTIAHFPVNPCSAATRSAVKTYAIAYLAAVLAMVRPRYLYEHKKFVGGITKTSKMVGASFSLPALKTCPVGCTLARLAGSVCSACYALRGSYLFPCTIFAQAARYEILKHAFSEHENGKFDFLAQWIESMVAIIAKLPYFRWHDSGDLFGRVPHLSAIAQVARLTPNTKHWLPTKESGTMLEFLEWETIPSNLCIRVSGRMVSGDRPEFQNVALCEPMMEDGRPADLAAVAGIGGRFACPAYTDDHKRKMAALGLEGCGTCVACYDVDVPTVVYPFRAA